MGNCIENPPNYLKNRMDIEYTPPDTVHQYLEHFTNFRKTAAASGPNRQCVVLSMKYTIRCIQQLQNVLYSKVCPVVISYEPKLLAY